MVTSRSARKRASTGVTITHVAHSRLTITTRPSGNCATTCQTVVYGAWCDARHTSPTFTTAIATAYRCAPRGSGATTQQTSHGDGGSMSDTTSSGSAEDSSSDTLTVTFFGVRGSTPCDSGDIARYGGNTSCVGVIAPGHDPVMFDMGTGMRYF